MTSAILRFWRYAVVICAVGAVPVAAQLPPREPTPAIQVEAALSAVWDAALEFIALNRIPIRVVDGASRFAYSDPFYVSLPDSMVSADCGRDAVGSVRGLPRTWGANAQLSLHVTPAGDKATVRAVAQFSQTDRFPCGPSNGRYERWVQEWIRARAMRR